MYIVFRLDVPKQMLMWLSSGVICILHLKPRCISAPVDHLLEGSTLFLATNVISTLPTDRFRCCSLSKLHGIPNPNSSSTDYVRLPAAHRIFRNTAGRDITWGVNLAGFFINLGDAASYKFSPELLLSYRTEGYREFCIRWYERKTNYLQPTKIPEGCFLKALTCQGWSRAVLPGNSWVLSSVHRAFIGDVLAQPRIY